MEKELDVLDRLEVIPDPVSLIESMRAFGYSVEAAIADIIDNSLSANARLIQVGYDASESPYVAVLDDGDGMAPSELTNAMRHGSANPSDTRKAGDLGRFGLGLKTASLSQCRNLTVVSKRDGTVSARRWDLDFVQETHRWLVVVPRPDELRGLPLYGKLEAQTSGTLVLWQDLDRLTAGSRDPQREMTARMAPLLEHLALVFHRFRQAEAGAPAVAITVNGQHLPPRDPFLAGNHFRQALETQTIRDERGEIVVAPFVLPPISKLSMEEIELAGGRDGLRGTQGFYVYRNRRLVIWGTWFRLEPKKEFFKLTRIQVDMPNTFDDLWVLDIKKSSAYPPDTVRKRLKELIPHFANASRRTITYPGRRDTTALAGSLWLRSEPRHGAFRYEPNLEHPLVRQLAQSMGKDEQQHLQLILECLGSALPLDAIYSDMCNDEPGTDQDAVKAELIELAAELHRITGMDMDRLFEIDPLSRHPEMHQSIREALKP